MNRDLIIDTTRRWIVSMVIGLNLCPFARRVYQGELIRYVVTDATTDAALFGVLEEELKILASAPITEVETTLLIHPDALRDFSRYNDFLGDGDRLLEQLGLAGVLQIAGFHPDFQFDGMEPTRVENYTNRSPYPMLHLLREASVSRVVVNADEAAEVPRRNIQTLRQMGLPAMLERLRSEVFGEL